MKIFNTRTLNLYTTTGKPYVGMWYVENGNYYQYPDQSVGSRTRLFTAEDLQRNIVRYRTKMRTVTASPIPIRAQPAEDDYLIGRFLRFFLQRRNAPLYTIMEVSKQSYNEAINVNRTIGVNESLYNNVAIQWHISGPREYVLQVNSRTLINTESIFPGISSYLSDPLQLYRPGVENL